ncbi:hypothetical protein HOI18_05035 [Candidatus Uhrbacteria bacterium]|jgi:hypothetical protein|nr:hypothetical protein [Candidatus Uhrbacteria bacterium]MBT5808609.1 hypothetical protein [Candidatus Uhrbacteria bacterium]
MSEEKKISWYNQLEDRIGNLAEQFGLDDVQRLTFRDFVTNLSRDQFRAGSKSGAGWAFDQARKGRLKTAS